MSEQPRRRRTIRRRAQPRQAPARTAAARPCGHPAERHPRPGGRLRRPAPARAQPSRRPRSAPTSSTARAPRSLRPACAVRPIPSSRRGRSSSRARSRHGRHAAAARRTAGRRAARARIPGFAALAASASAPAQPAQVRGLAIIGWVLLSAVLFFISASTKSGDLPGARPPTDALTSGGPMLFSPNNILVVGLDSRPTTGYSSKEGGANHNELDARTDTLMIWRVGGGVSRRLSIPRDTWSTSPAAATRPRSTPPGSTAVRRRRSGSSSN